MNAARACIGIAAVVILSVLSGCDANLFADPIQVRIVDTQLAVRVCAPHVAERITVKERTTGDWQDIWRAEGDVRLLAGDELTTSSLDSQFSTVQVGLNPSGESGAELVVVIYGAEGDNSTSTFTITEATLDGEWTDPDGASTNENC